MPRQDTWMPLYIGDYLRDTGHLTVAEHGAYFLLLIQAWTRGGSLPADSERLRILTKMDARDWKRSQGTVMEFFTRDGDTFRHKRVDREIAIAATTTEQRRAAGKASAQAREAQRRGNARSTSVATGPQQSADETADLHLHQEEESNPPYAPLPPECRAAARPAEGVAADEEGSRPRLTAKRGTRLPADWQLDPAGAAYATEHGVDPALAAEEFRNYWLARPGRDATKLNWAATFRNRVLELAERGRFRLNASPTPTPTAANPTGRAITPMSGGF